MEKLDLHGLTYDMSKSKTIRFIERYWDEDIQLEIVTGNSLIMREVVTDILDEYKLKYQIGDALGMNRGCLTVYMEK